MKVRGKASLEYSTDGATWSNYTWDGSFGLVITLANIGDFVMFRGDNDRLGGMTFYNNFTMTGRIAASGSVNTLLSKDGIIININQSTFAFFGLFRDCTSLTTAPALPATTLADSCYSQMFRNCTSLTTAPALPATTLAEYCYSQMFQNCTSLTSAPALPATTLVYDCYSQMFNGCGSLSSVEVNFTDWSTGTTEWLDSVAATGTFHCPAGLTIPSRDASGVPANWTIVNDVTA